LVVDGHRSQSHALSLSARQSAAFVAGVSPSTAYATRGVGALARGGDPRSASAVLIYQNVHICVVRRTASQAFCTAHSAATSFGTASVPRKSFEHISRPLRGASFFLRVLAGHGKTFHVSCAHDSRSSADPIHFFGLLHAGSRSPGSAAGARAFLCASVAPYNLLFNSYPAVRVGRIKFVQKCHRYPVSHAYDCILSNLGVTFLMNTIWTLASHCTSPHRNAKLCYDLSNLLY